VTKAEAKRRVIRFAANILSGSRGLMDAVGLFADGAMNEVGPDDAERLRQAIDDLVAELDRRGQEPEDRK
jgi:hypothetical protein